MNIVGVKALGKKVIYHIAALLTILGVGFVSKGAPTLTVESALVEPNGICTLNITYSQVVNGLLAIQVGPEGALVYDPTAIQVLSVLAVEPFTALYKVDDGQGHIRFALVTADSPAPSGTILQLTVKAIGPTGTDTQIYLSYIDDAIDGTQSSIPPETWYRFPGVVKINTPPTVDFSWSSVGTEVQFESQANDVDGSIISYSWDFGDGSPLSGEVNPVHRYALPGTYSVTLIVTDDDGVPNSISKNVTVGNLPPVVDFDWTPDQPTTSDLIQFVSNANDPDGTIVQYEWDFGDGSFSSEQNPTHQYATPGEYRVTLRCTDDRGASEELSKPVQVSNSPPVACFDYVPQNPSTSDSVQFLDCSTDPDGQIVAWSWNFGDGHTSSLRNPTHQFTQNGVYQVTLTITDNNGAQDQISQPVSVGNIPPVANFDYTPDFPLVGQPVEFTDHSEDPDGHIVSWLWDFGDGFQSTAQNPAHAYQDDGVYTVRLTVTDDDGATTWIEKLVVIGNSSPHAAFSFSPPAPLAGQTIQFIDESTDPDGQIMSWEWDFGDGTTSTERNPTHTYETPGTYKVKLQVVDDDGASDMVEQEVNVGGVLADFEWSPRNPIAMEPVQFTDRSISGEDDIVSWSWDFDDGGTSTRRNPVHTFEDDGPYSVRLRVETKSGMVAQAVYVVEVRNAPPVPDFSFAPEQPRIGEEVEFNAAGTTDPDGDELISFQWDFNGDGDIDATGVAVTHVFTTQGGHDVTLYVTDADGGQASVTKTVPIEVNAPVARFTYEPQYPRAGETVFFDASESSDPDGRIVFYEWDFNGDGISDRTGKLVTWAFPVGGTHDVTLTVTDDDGLKGRLTRGVYVRINTPPVAAFSFVPEQPTVGVEIQFNDESEDPDGEIVSWHWNFGDGSVSDEQNPTHVYIAKGDYQVTLTVTDDQGLSDTVTQVVSLVNSPPEADFSWTPERPAARQEVVFSAEATDPDPDDMVTSYTWDFGDGTTGSGEEITHVYSDPGVYEVQLTVTDSNGASSSVTKSITVAQNKRPSVTSLTISPSTPLVGETVTFNAVVTDPEDDPIVGWEWDFGDGSTATDPPPITHTYDRFGVFEVRVRVRDMEGYGPWYTVDVGVLKAEGQIAASLTANPVNNRAVVRFVAPEDTTGFRFRVFDILGRLVYESESPTDDNIFTWDLVDSKGRDVPNGLYFYLITAVLDGRTIRSEVGRILVLR